MIPLQLQEKSEFVLFVAILHLAPILTPTVANGGAQNNQQRFAALLVVWCKPPMLNMEKEKGKQKRKGKRELKRSSEVISDHHWNGRPVEGSKLHCIIFLICAARCALQPCMARTLKEDKAPALFSTFTLKPALVSEAAPCGVSATLFSRSCVSLGTPASKAEALHRQHMQKSFTPLNP
jgi:hypothetical protein